MASKPQATQNILLKLTINTLIRYVYAYFAFIRMQYINGTYKKLVFWNTKGQEMIIIFPVKMDHQLSQDVQEDTICH